MKLNVYCVKSAASIQIKAATLSGTWEFEAEIWLAAGAKSESAAVTMATAFAKTRGGFIIDHEQLI